MKLADALLLSVECPSGGASCAACLSMCECYPGRLTPADATAAMDAGRGAQLMASTLATTTVLRPAIVGWEGLSIEERNMAPGRCVFLTVTGRCEIHESEFKPLECRVARCTEGDAVPYDAAIAAIERAWRAPSGRAVLARWKTLTQGGGE